MRSAHCNTGRRYFGDFPVVGAFEQLGHESRVQRVSGSIGDQSSENRLSDQRKIAKQIEDLVAHEFVRETQRSIVQHSLFGQDNRVLQRTTAYQAIRLELFNLVINAE